MKVLKHFNYKDVLRGFRYGLSLKYSFIFFVLLLIPSILFVLEYYWLSYILFSLAFIIGKTVVSKLLFERLKGDEFFPILRAFTSSLSSTLTYISFIVLGLVLSSVLWLLFQFFKFLSSFHIVLAVFLYPVSFVVFILLIYVLTGIVLSETVAFPSIVIQKFDAFDVLFESLSLFNTQIYRYVAYKLINILLSSFAFLVAFSIFSYLNSLLFPQMDTSFISFIQSLSFTLSVYTSIDFMSYLVFIYKRDGIDLIQSISSKPSIVETSKDA